eukprot:2619479-Rhodomonas_salina.3
MAGFHYGARAVPTHRMMRRTPAHRISHSRSKPTSVPAASFTSSSAARGPGYCTDFSACARKTPTLQSRSYQPCRCPGACTTPLSASFLDPGTVSSGLHTD